ncbi:MAG: alpha/beta hydrolase [Candidatus Doudnabacteria bacterium]|nr:alpha/beta hydrolase [Candidatus Doudnabacteria bacterium]
MKRKDRRDWEKTGWLVRESHSKPGTILKLPWSHMQDRMKYDLLTDIKKLVMPVLLVVGSKDEGNPPDDQKILFDALPGKKELHIIEGADHNFRPHEKYLPELKAIMDNWIKSLDR